MQSYWLLNQVVYIITTGSNEVTDTNLLKSSHSVGSAGPGFDSLPWRPAIVMEFLRGSPQYLQANVGIVLY
jgi:hypothetical protein